MGFVREEEEERCMSALVTASAGIYSLAMMMKLVNFLRWCLKL